MIDDNLEKLLLNVDDSSNFSDVRNSNIKSHEKIVRKSDKNIGDDFAGQSPEQYSNNLNNQKSDPDIQTFNVGHINIFKYHEELMKEFMIVLNDINYSESVLQNLKKYKYNFLRNIESIEKLCNDYITTQSYSSLKRTAKQELPAYFPDGTVSDNRINFIILKEIFINLREYNSFIRKNLNDLTKDIEVVNLISEGKDLYSKLLEIIAKSISYCKKTDKFISFIALVLSIPDEDFDVLKKDIAKRIFYRDSMNYSFSDIFSHQILNKKIEKPETPISEISQSENQHNNNKINNKKSSNSLEKNNIISSSFNFDSPDTDIHIDNLLFNLPGKSSWNTKEPYLVHINNEGFEKNVEDLKKTIYFTKTHDEAKNMNANVKKAMLRNFSTNTAEKSAAYENFIINEIKNIIVEINSNFKMEANTKSLLIYHIGPGTFYKIIKNKFDTLFIGLCFKDIGENKLSRFIPNEFIKFTILNWFENNINILKISFDSIAFLNDIKSFVHNRYLEHQTEIMNKIATAAKHLYEKEGKVLDKNAMFKKKSKDLFGHSLYYIYKRFVDLI